VAGSEAVTAVGIRDKFRSALSVLSKVLVIEGGIGILIFVIVSVFTIDLPHPSKLFSWIRAHDPLRVDSAALYPGESAGGP
jgi:hypothetical protein